MGIESVNYKYLGITIIFLIFTIFYLQNIKKGIQRKAIETSYNSTIKVLTQKGEIYMDPNIFEMYLTRLKNNIISLHQKFDKSNCQHLKQYLNKSKINTKQYIDINTKNVNPLFYDMNNQNNIFNNGILQEKELLKNKLANKTEGDNNDESDESDKLRYQLLELITDIDLILLLIRLSMCKKGAIDLSCLDQIILELYRTQCSAETDTTESFGEPQPTVVEQSNRFTEPAVLRAISCGTNDCNLNTPTPCYGKKNIYHDASVNTRFGISPENLSRCVPSTDFLDTKTMPYKKAFEKKPVNINKQRNIIDQSQIKEKPFDCNKMRLGKQLKVSDYAYDRLYFYRDYRFKNRNGKILDNNIHSGLLNDYNDDNLQNSILTEV
jgi:hypothetical protein